MNNLAGHIKDYLQTQQDAYMDDLRAVAGIDSFTQDQAGVNRVVEWFAARLMALGGQVQRISNDIGHGDDLLATFKGSGRRRIVLLGHTDTVYPAGTAAARPVTVQGDKVLGPGTCDMKAGLLTGLYALMALREIGFKDYAELVYLAVSDEETDVRHGIPLIKRVCTGADAVFSLEAARENGDLVAARKGVLWWQVKAYGRSAHAGVEPEKGRNAVLALAYYATALSTLNDFETGRTLNIGLIEGGGLPSIVPDQGRMRFDLRAFSQGELDAGSAQVRDILSREVVADIRLEIEAQQVMPPMPRTPAIDALVELAQACARELGFSTTGAATGGGGDCSYAAQVGAPVLDGLGPIGGLDHGPDEYILFSSIVPRTALLAALIIAAAQKDS